MSWANTVRVHWTGHGALVSALINDVATPPIVTSWIDIISLTFLLNQDHVISILNFPVNDFCHDSIGNKLFGFVVSRSDEPIVIGVCGMRLADQDHRIVSEPITSGSFLESGPGFNGLGKDNWRTRWETFKFWDLVGLIQEVLRYYQYSDHNSTVICDLYPWLVSHDGKHEV